jgi:hypothetical protein
MILCERWGPGMVRIYVRNKVKGYAPVPGYVPICPVCGVEHPVE